MALDWIPNRIENGETVVKCEDCGEVAEFDGYAGIYRCDCDFGVTPEALAMGVPGYVEGPTLDTD